MEINKIYNENCLDTMKRMPDNFIDLTVTSPPYDNLRDYNGYSFDFEDIAKELYRVTKKGGVVVWVVADATVQGSETGTSFKQALFFKEIGFKLHDTMLYLKKGVTFPSNNRYYNTFEYMFIFCKDKLKTFNPIIDRKNIWYGEKIHSTQREKNGDLKKKGGCGKIIGEFGLRYNYWFANTESRGIQNSHPAVFPESLANDHIISWSNENDLIYDPFMGSGTTAKMVILNKRKYIGSEISKEYCDLAKKRIENTFNKTLF